MSKRQEFSKAVRVEIIRRATVNNVIYCEGCGCIATVWEIDHTLADGLKVDKSKPLTAKDGKLLCAGAPDTCHGAKTAIDRAMIDKAKRVEEKHLRAKATARTGLEGPSLADKRDRNARRSHERSGGKIGVPARRDIHTGQVYR